MSETSTGLMPPNEEERLAVIRAKAQADRLLATVGTSAPSAFSPASARVGDEAMVIVTVPRAFHHNIDHHRRVDFPVGTYACPQSLAESWWPQAQGIEILSHEQVMATVPVAELSVEDRRAVLRGRAEAAAAHAKSLYQDAMDAGVDFQQQRPDRPQAPLGEAEVGVTDEDAAAELLDAETDPARPADVTPADWLSRHKASFDAKATGKKARAKT